MTTNPPDAEPSHPASPAGDVFERLLQIAWARTRAHAFEEAETLYRQLSALGPGRFEPLAGLGVLHYLQGRAAEALDAFDAARALRGADPSILVNRGLVLLALGRCEDALASYDEALALAPDFAEALLGRGDPVDRVALPLAALAD